MTAFVARQKGQQIYSKNAVLCLSNRSTVKKDSKNTANLLSFCSEVEIHTKRTANLL